MSWSRKRTQATVASVVALSVLASGCSSSTARQAGLFGGSGANPVDVPVLGEVSGATGPLAPTFAGSTLPFSKQHLVATSTEPIINASHTSVQGVLKKTTRSKRKDKGSSNGSWQYWVGSLTAIPSQSAGWTQLTGVQPNGSVQVPTNLIKDGNVYQYKAMDPNGNHLTPVVFSVDTQRVQQQGADNFSNVSVGLSSGSPMVKLTTHQVKSPVGNVGFGLEYRPGNRPWPGLPNNWSLVTPTSSQWDQIMVPTDDASVVRLHSKLGGWLNYQHSTGGSYQPLWTQNSPSPTGQFPTLVRNTKDTNHPWTLTDVNQTVTTFGAHNSTTRIATPSSVTSANVQGMTLDYDGDGRVTGITDPVSRRSVKVTYGGGDCPDAGEGTIKAPDGLICKITYWDETEAWFGYVNHSSKGAQLARLVDFGNAGADGAKVTDLAYDNIGRVAKMRTPLVTAAQAAADKTSAQPDDDSLLTALQYDDTGRVSKIRAAAPTPGGQRLEHNYVYAASAAGFVTSIKDQNGRVTMTQSFDPNTFNPLAVTDIDGKTANYAWDPATGLATKQRSQSGLTTSYQYDPDTQQQTKQLGPSTSTDTSVAPLSTFEYDEDYSTTTAAGTPWTGLNFQVWPNSSWSGMPGSTTLGPANNEGQIPSALQVTWLTPPPGATPARDGNDKGWSARFTGNINLKTTGQYSIASPGSRLWVDGIECAGTACTNMNLNAGTHSVRIDITAPTGGANGVSLLMDPGSVARTPIAMSKLSPGYGLQTRKNATNEALSSKASTVLRSIAKYEQPGQQRPTSVTNTAGQVSRTAYEPASVANSQLGRPTGVTIPGGSTSGFAYWAGDAKATSPCEDHDEANQGGPQSETHDANPAPGQPNGLSTKYWYTAAGVVAAAKLGDGAPACNYYDDAGRLIALRQGQGDQESATEIDYSVDGNPLITEVTYRNAANAGGLASETKSRVEVDLLGREVRTTDVFGTTTETTYDPATGSAAKTTTTVNPGTDKAYQTVQTAEYYTSGTTGSPKQVVVTDNRGSKPVSASWNYRGDGAVSSVALSNGSTGSYSYDQNLNTTGINWACADSAKCGKVGAWSTQQSYSPTGRILTSGTKVGSDSAMFGYVFDTSTRLQSANLTTSLSGLPKEWDYTYDANSNRTSMKVDSATTSYTYDKADRLLTVAGNPALAGSVVYNGNNSITKLGNLEFEYNQYDQVTSVNDPSTKTKVEYTYAGVGKMVAKTTTVNGVKTVIRYSSTGVLLDENNQPYMQQVQLASNVHVQRAIPALKSEPARAAGDVEGEDAANANADASAAPTVKSEASESAQPSGESVPPTEQPAEESVAPSESASVQETPTPAPTEAPVPAEPAAPAPAPAAAALSAGSTLWNYQSLKRDTFFSIDDAGNPVRGGLTVYDPFGGRITPAPTSGSAVPDVAWDSREGIETDTLSVPVNLLGARLYIPALGRFTSTDPAQGGSANLYDYANQDPINNTDPTGHSAKQWWTMLKIVAIGMLTFSAAGAVGSAAGISGTLAAAEGSAEVSEAAVAAGESWAAGAGALTGATVATVAYGLGDMGEPSHYSWYGWFSAVMGGAAFGALAGATRATGLIKDGVADAAKAAEVTAGKALKDTAAGAEQAAVEKAAVGSAQSGSNIVIDDAQSGPSSRNSSGLQDRRWSSFVSFAESEGSSFLSFTQ